MAALVKSLGQSHAVYHTLFADLSRQDMEFQHQICSHFLRFEQNVPIAEHTRVHVYVLCVYVAFRYFINLVCPLLPSPIKSNHSAVFPVCVCVCVCV